MTVNKLCDDKKIVKAFGCKNRNIAETMQTNAVQNLAKKSPALRAIRREISNFAAENKRQRTDLAACNLSKTMLKLMLDGFPAATHGAN